MSKDHKKVLLVTDDPETDSMSIGDVIVIDEDRYRGAYSGHSFTAWVNRIPFNASGADVPCAEFWDNNTTIFGGGSNPDEAVKDLLRKLDILMDNPPEGVEKEYFPCRPRFIYYTGVYKHSVPHENDRTVCIDGDMRFFKLYPRAAAFIGELLTSGRSRLFLN